MPGRLFAVIRVTPAFSPRLQPLPEAANVESGPKAASCSARVYAMQEMVYVCV